MLPCSATAVEIETPGGAGGVFAAATIAFCRCWSNQKTDETRNQEQEQHEPGLTSPPASLDHWSGWWFVRFRRFDIFDNGLVHSPDITEDRRSFFF